MSTQAQIAAHSPEDLGWANRDNHIAMLDHRNRLFLDRSGRGEIQVADSGLHWCRLADGVFNIIYGADLAGSPQDPEIADRIAAMTERVDTVWGEPARWFVSSHDKPRGLGDLLAAHGWEYGFAWLEFGRSLTNVADLAGSGQEMIAVEPVKDEATRREWMTVQKAGYELDGSLAQYIDEITGAFVADDEPSVTLYLARLPDGRPAATAALFVHERIAGVYMVATHPSFRRQGIASLLMRRLMSDAAQAGCDCCILQSSDTGQNLYHALGFTQTGITLIYRREPDIG